MSIKRNRVQLFFKEQSRTDQSMKKAVNINTIVAQVAKTGVMPFMSEGQYFDTTVFTGFQDAYAKVQEAVDLFYDLPIDVRKAMGNDPYNMEEFFANPQNFDLLEKHGLINVQRQETIVKEDPQLPKNSETIPVGSGVAS